MAEFILESLQKNNWPFQMIIIEEIKKLECYCQIESLRVSMRKSFEIPQNSECYVQMSPDDVNMFLFVLFGSIDTLSTQPQYRNLKPNTKSKLENIFRNIISENSESVQFINKIKLNRQKIFTNWPLLSLTKNICDRVAPEALPKKYRRAYFKLPQYKPIQNINCNTLVVSFQEGEKVVLAFLQTFKPFSVPQIEQILNNLNQKTIPFLQQQKPIKTQTETKKVEPNMPTHKQSKKKSSHRKGSASKIIKEQNHKQKVKKFWNDQVTLIFFAFVLCFSILALQSIKYYNLGDGMNLQMRIKTPLTQSQKEILEYKKVFQNSILNPLQEKLSEIHEVYLEPYFINPFQNGTLYIRQACPLVDKIIAKIYRTICNMNQDLNQLIQQINNQEMRLSGSEGNLKFKDQMEKIKLEGESMI